MLRRQLHQVQQERDILVRLRPGSPQQREDVDAVYRLVSAIQADVKGWQCTPAAGFSGTCQRLLRLAATRGQQAQDGRCSAYGDHQASPHGL